MISTNRAKEDINKKIGLYEPKEYPKDSLVLRQSTIRPSNLILWKSLDKTGPTWVDTEWEAQGSIQENPYMYDVVNTGVITGGQITQGAGDNDIIISAGAGIVTDRSDRLNPHSKLVQWEETTYTLNWDGGTAWSLFIFIDENGQLEAFTNTGSIPSGHFRSNIYIGSVSRSYDTGVTEIGGILSAPVTTEDMSSTMIDYFRSTFIYKVRDGLLLEPIPGGLTTALTDGTLTGLNINFHNDTQNPHAVSITGLSPLTFDYMEYYDAGFFAINITDFDPTQWDNNGTLETVGNNRATIQTLFYSMLYQKFIAFYGTEEFKNFAQAKDRVARYLLEFRTPPVIQDGLIPIGYLVLDENCIDLDDENTASVIPWR